MNKKIAFITGITGQDGSYLAELLLKKNYIVHGLKRKSSLFNTDRIDHIYQDPHERDVNLFLHSGDLIDANNIIYLINKIKPDEIYNLAAQSHVAISFEQPEYTANVNALGTLRILEAIKILNLEKKIKFYQASTSELYGKAEENPQNEHTPFNPQSPYAISKLFSYWIVKNYRDSYGIFASNGILFNHESPRRGETFVTRKITRSLVNIFFGLEKRLYLGNLDSLRDWGHASDYVLAQWLILQKEIPNDYVIATGTQYSIREFLTWACEFLGIKIKFIKSGLDEVAIVDQINNPENKFISKGQIIMSVDKKYFRPSEVESLKGDYSFANDQLNWKPTISTKELCKEMIESDFSIARKKNFLNKNYQK